jgi:hypothetical protein
MQQRVLSLSIAIAVLLLYILTSRSIGNGEPVMPVDDAYIHFQYARQIASLQPYVYNPGLAPTSGATSFLYPYLLAVGYALGFQGLSLGYWAMGIGGLALFGAMWAVYEIGMIFSKSALLSLAVMTAFALNGAVAWHFMSGMETGFMMSFALLTLYGFVSRRLRLFTIFATFLALTRPEGSIMAFIAVILFAVEKRRFVPIVTVTIASLVQPLVNFALTRSFSASGNQAKSLFGMIPAYPDEIANRIVTNFVRIWRELLLGVGEHGVLYLMPLLVIVTFVGVVLYSKQQKRWTLLVLLIGWFFAVIVAVSTLDTAFWHFKRYQMPLIALLFPLSVLALQNKRLQWAFCVPLVLVSLLTLVQFHTYYQDNVQNVVQQPLAMAHWLRENTSQDSVVAVHDVGMMRYLGERTTLDMVGLTTPDAADYWRNGPGAVGEFLTRLRPDYVASYTTIRGLDYLARTGVYGEQLAGFLAEYDPRYNVALGAEFQGIFKPTWIGVDEANNLHQPVILNYLEGFTQVDQLDIADLKSELHHDYQWTNDNRPLGFATEFYQQSYIGCSECVVADGGRLITGEERFILNTPPDNDILLVTRVHPVHSGTFDVFANGEKVATRWIPAQQGEWLEIPTLIPSEFISDHNTHIRIVPSIPDGSYMPYMHWAYSGTYPDTSTFEPDVTFQDGAVQATIDYEIEAETLTVKVTWFGEGNATGDYRLFAHVYDDPNQPPIAQAEDKLPANGTMPLGNTLPGAFSDDFVVDLAQVPSGQYQIAVGLYDPLTNERLMPQTNLFEIDIIGKRLFIGKVRQDAR